MHSSNEDDPLRKVNSQYAELNQDVWKETNQVWTLFPENGNVHEMTAGKEGCAILDVITPDYNGVDRCCTYFKEEPLHAKATARKLVPFHPDLYIETV